jgi:hypothetical protein
VKVFVRLSLFIVLLLGAVLVAPAPTHAAPDTPPERTPTTCSQGSNEIAGRITLDADHDNWPDDSEGVPGITVYLANIHSGTTILQTVTTDAEGCYRFIRGLTVMGQLHRIGWSGMHPSAALIHDPDNGVTPGTPNYVFRAAHDEPADTDVVYRPGTVDPYITHCPYDQGTGEIAGMVALDANGNNRADPGEGIGGALVTLAVSLPSQVVGSATTDANGCYRITRVEPPLVMDAGDGIQGCCNHLVEGDIQDIQGCCNHRTPDATTYMYVKAILPPAYGEIEPSYDPNGRQTPGVYYEVFTRPNGTFESDFLYRDFTPTAVSVAGFSAQAETTPAWLAFGLSGIALTGAVVFLARRRTLTT